MRQCGHTSGLPVEKGASREIVPVQRPRTLLSRCEIRTQKHQGTMSGIYHAQRKIRPVGTISYEGMRVVIARWFIQRIKQMVDDEQKVFQL